MVERVHKSRRKAHEENGEVNDGDKVWVTIVRTVQLQAYESYKVDAGFSQTIKAGEDPIELMADMESQISAFVLETTEAIKEELSPKVIRRNRG